jgi:beta-lactamase superfamily II metal-dependent hydrolase
MSFRSLPCAGCDEIGGYVLEVHLLPAKQGDAIWVRWGKRKLTHQLLVDMGTPGVGRALRERLAGCGVFEALVVTHIDADHIGGVLTCVVDRELDGVTFRDVWFNGLEHVRSSTPLSVESYGGRQGLALQRWLEHRAWNVAMNRGPVVRRCEPIVLDGGLLVTVLGPTRERLDELAPVWEREVQSALTSTEEAPKPALPPELEAYGARRIPRAPVLRDDADLQELASGATGNDRSAANGSSIVLLLEHGDHAVLLAGDAYAHDLIDGIASLGRRGPLRLDAFKLPHHGSHENITRELLAKVRCRRFLFSTDGTRFAHPDAAAVACVIAHARRTGRNGLELGFNSRSVFSGWWDNAAWQRAFGYRAEYGTDGLVVRLPATARVPAPRSGRRRSGAPRR